MRGIYVLSTVLASAVLVSSHSAQLSREEVKHILFDFRPGVDWRLKEANAKRLAKTGETHVPLLIECLNWRLPDWLADQVEESAKRRSAPMAERADGSSVGIQGWSETVLVRIGKPAVPHLIDSFQTQPETTSPVARILGKIGDVRAIPSLIGVLKDKSQNWPNRRQAAYALQILDAWEAVPCLIDSLGGQLDDSLGSDELVTAVATALAELTGRSFGCTMVVSQADKAWDVVTRYRFARDSDEQKKAIAQWRHWWERHQVLLDEVGLCLTEYAERLKDQNDPEIKARRSDDYIRRIKGRRGRLIVADNPQGEWFDEVEGRKITRCKDYQISIVQCRDDNGKAVVTSRDVATLDTGGAQIAFTVTIERVLQRRNDSWLVSEENLLEWEQAAYRP